MRFARWHALCSKLDVVSIRFAWLTSARVLAVSFLCAIALFSLSLDARAQSFTIVETTTLVERAEERNSGEDPYAISYKDCIDDDPFEQDYSRQNPDGKRTWLRITVQRMGNAPRGSTLEVWASQGADCTNSDERLQGRRCHRVYRESRPETLDPSVSLNIYPRAVIAKRDVAELETSNPSDPDKYPGPEICSEPIEQGYSFYVMLIQGDTVLNSDLWDQTRIDTIGPNPPDSITASAGEENVFLEWEIPSEAEDPDTEGFDFYCAEAGTLGPIDPDESGMGGAGGPGTCGSGLVPDQLPAIDSSAIFECGSVTGRGTRKGRASGLENGVTYAVAVAARDQVGNAGPLSEIACVTPAEVDTFFDKYKAAGGRGGGGFCAWGMRQGYGFRTLLILTGLLVWVRRRSHGGTAARSRASFARSPR